MDPYVRACPVCAGARHASLLEKENLRLVQCAACGMVFANPVAKEFVEGTFYDQVASPMYLSPAKLESDYAPVRFQRELKWFTKFCPQGRVLDVGCSTGAFLHQLQNCFPSEYQVLGTDVSGPALAHAASRGVPVLASPFLTHDFGNEKFAAICFWAVLEHLPNPGDYLARAYHLLEPGGHYFLVVPNWNSLAIGILGSRYRYVMPQHLNYFTRRTLLRLLQTNAPGRVRVLSASHFNPIVLWQDFRGGAAASDADRAALLQKTTRWKSAPWLTPLKWIYAGTEWLLARFGLADNLLAVVQKNSS